MMFTLLVLLLLEAPREFPAPITIKAERLFPAPKVHLLQVSPKVARTGYPIRGSWWTGCSSWTHLTQSVHTGKFPNSWLQTLTNQEVQSLHSDDHEHRVQWQYVPGNKVNVVTIEASDDSKLLPSQCFYLATLSLRH